MKNIFFLFFLAFSISTIAQTTIVNQGLPHSLIVYKGGYKIDTVFVMPVRGRAGVFTNTPTTGRIQLNRNTLLPEFHDGLGWHRFMTENSTYFSWANLLGKPTFSTVAFTGDYNSLINRPPSGMTYSAGMGIEEVTLGATSREFKIDTAVAMTKAKAETAITQLENQIALKSNTADVYTKIQSDVRYLQSFSETDPAWNSQKINYSTTAQANSLYKPLGYFPTWTEVSGKPATFSPSTHTHPISEVTGLQTALDGKQAAGAYLTSESDPVWLTQKASYSTTAQANSLYRPITYVPAWSDITGKPSFATVATTGSYNDLTNKPVIPIPDYAHNATTTGTTGNAVFYLTSDKTSTGTALYTNITYVGPIINDSTLNYTYGWSYNPATKALTVNAKSAAGINVALVGLTLLGAPVNVAAGTQIFVLVKGT